MVNASIQTYWWVTQVFFDALDWKECTERVEKFKRQFIHQNIIDTEIDDMSYPFFTADYTW